MTTEKTPRQNRIREALGKLYDQHPPHFREYLRRFEEDPTSRVFAPLAEAYRRMGRIEEAITICRTGLEHHPDFHGGRVALAKCLLDKKQIEEAKSELEAVVRDVPENLLAQRLLGDTFLLLNDLPAAIHAYKMALLLSPSDVVLSEKIHELEKKAESKPPSDSSIDEFVQAASIQEETTPVEQENVEVSHVEPGLVKNVETSAEDPVDDFMVPLPPHTEEDVPSDPGVVSEINALLGVKENDSEDDSFKIQHVSAIFIEPDKESRKEITTETLGDLYFSQEQYQHSLEIFEKIAGQRPTADLTRKINLCREKLGVDRTSIARNRKIEALRSILKRSQDSNAQA